MTHDADCSIWRASCHTSCRPLYGGQLGDACVLSFCACRYLATAVVGDVATVLEAGRPATLLALTDLQRRVLSAAEQRLARTAPGRRSAGAKQLRGQLRAAGRRLFFFQVRFGYITFISLFRLLHHWYVWHYYYY